ncbi:hypothetical protein Tco_0947647 [Tanacetum coccineum]
MVSTATLSQFLAVFLHLARYDLLMRKVLEEPASVVIILNGSTKRRDCIAEDIGVLLPHQVDWLCYCIFLKKMNAWCTQFCTQQRHNMETKHNMPIVPPQPSQSR